MYIAMNRFQIAPGQEDAFEEAWRRRESHLDGVPGFLSFWLLRGPEGDFISCSRWESEAAFNAFVASDAFKKVTSWGKQNILAGPPRHTTYREG